MGSRERRKVAENDLLKRNELDKEKAEKKRREGMNGGEEVIRRIIEKEREKRKKKIRESNCSRAYQIIMKEEKPEYLNKKMKKGERILLARCKCGNEMRAGEYWKEEEERACRLCESEEEDMWHILRECRDTKREEGIEEVLQGEGKGIRILKEIDKIRKNQM